MKTIVKRIYISHCLAINLKYRINKKKSIYIFSLSNLLISCIFYKVFLINNNKKSLNYLKYLSYTF